MLLFGVGVLKAVGDVLNGLVVGNLLVLLVLMESNGSVRDDGKVLVFGE
jgi:hypothetical protein